MELFLSFDLICNLVGRKLSKYPASKTSSRGKLLGVQSRVQRRSGIESKQQVGKLSIVGYQLKLEAEIGKRIRMLCMRMYDREVLSLVG